MKCKNLIKAFFCLFLTACGFAQQQPKEERLDSLFTFLNTQNQFSGSVLIAEKGKIIYKGGKGYRNETTKELNNTETVFELASCSKQFIGVGIALLHRDGKIDYKADITKYLPELTNFRGVKIYDLLHHTSGIPEFLAGFRKDWNKEKIALNQDVISYYAEQKTPLEFMPGTRFAYSNTNYAFLASIIERVSGKTLDSYLKKEIFEPLKMNCTFVYNRRLLPRNIENYAYGYVWIPNSFEKATEDDKRVGGTMSYSMDGIVGNAKINSTVEDLYRWITALHDNQLLTRTELDEVLRSGETNEAKKTFYGFGFDVSQKNNELFSYGHTGSWDGYITLIYYNVPSDRTIIILNNFDKGVCPYEEITAILDNRPAADPLPRKVDVPEATIQRFAGEYTDPDNPSAKHIITYLDRHLVYNTDTASWDMRFFPTSENTFRAIRQGGTDGTMKFTQQTDGSVVLEMTQYGELIGRGVRR